MRGAPIAIVLALMACHEDDFSLPRVHHTPERVSSAFFDNERIAGRFSVTASGDGRSQVSAELRPDGIDSLHVIQLSAGDVLSADSDGDSRVLIEDFVAYVATFDDAYAGKQFTLRLTREGREPWSATVALPEPFDLLSPTEGQSVSRAEDLQVTWAPADSQDTMALRYSDCARVWAYPIDGDPGTHTVDGDLTSTRDDASRCSAPLSLLRTREGVVAPGLHPTTRAAGIQERTVHIASTP